MRPFGGGEGVEWGSGGGRMGWRGMGCGGGWRGVEVVGWRGGGVWDEEGVLGCVCGVMEGDGV